MDYTRQAKEVLKIAEKSAKEMAHPYVGTEHLLLGLRKVYTGVAAQVLGTNGVDEENIQKVMSELISPAGEMPGRKKPEYSPRLEYILEDSKTEAEQFRSEEIGTEHMLTALIRDMDCVAAKILTTLGANLQKIYQEIFETVGIDPKMYQEEYGPEEGRKNGVLDQYGTPDCCVLQADVNGKATADFQSAYDRAASSICMSLCYDMLAGAEEEEC